ncbi:MAG: hypothetical protein B7Z06_11365, partial [Flavobacteriales bacterium 32-35-8]
QVKGKVGNIVIKPAKSYVKVTSENIKYLEILDVIKDLNTILDLQKSEGLLYLKKVIYDFDATEIKKLVSYGLAYPPKVRALLGALLETVTTNAASYQVKKKSINPSSSYKYGIDASLLSTAISWNIV